MSHEEVVLFKEDSHQCIFFTDLVSGEGIPSNQLAIISNGEGALFDPGGDLTYSPLSLALSKHLSIHNKLRYVFASHQDPDIITSLPRWLMHTQCHIVASRLWTRFLPHLISGFVSGKMQSSLANRMIEIPDDGMKIPLGNSTIIAIPAHFLHSVGNFHFYDPKSKIFFSGDVGASVTPGKEHIPVTDMHKHTPLMEGFHKRYMASNKACRKWVELVRCLDIEWMVPQHGKIFKGKEQITIFLDWFEKLECGIDLM